MNDVCEEIAETLENLESHCQKPLRDYENNDDESDFRLFFLRGENRGKVEYHTDLRFKPKQGELVLVDEADLFMYEQFVTFFIMVK